MNAPGLKTVTKATTERIFGDGPSRGRAFVAAIATGAATAVLTYKLLRSG